MATPYASVIELDVPIVVQHTRLDSRQAENAFLSTIAFPADTIETGAATTCGAVDRVLKPPHARV